MEVIILIADTRGAMLHILLKHILGHSVMARSFFVKGMVHFRCTILLTKKEQFKCTILLTKKERALYVKRKRFIPIESAVSP